MAHIIYQTEGIILGKHDFGEANRWYEIFTEKFGMIKAVAQGARLAKSKLKYNLDLFSYSNFSVIASREFWRIIDAEQEKNWKKIFQDSDKLLLLGKIAKFLKKMIPGEEKNECVWTELKDFFIGLSDSDITREQMQNLEIQTVAKILNSLGYMDEIPESKEKIIPAINKAIKESML